MVVIHNTDEFEKEVLDFQGKVVIDFFATWCGPCKMQGPILEEFASEHPEVKCVKIDTDECPNIAMDFHVVSIPTLVVIENGEEINRAIGVTQDIEELL